MNRVNFARCSGVVVDLCTAHGTWFDHTELERIVRFIQGGGMQRSRAIEAEHLERERKRLLQAREQPDPARSTYLGSDSLEALALWGVIRAAGSLLEWLIKR